MKYQRERFPKSGARPASNGIYNYLLCANGVFCPLPPVGLCPGQGNTVFSLPLQGGYIYVVRRSQDGDTENSNNKAAFEAQWQGFWTCCVRSAGMITHHHATLTSGGGSVLSGQARPAR